MNWTWDELGAQLDLKRSMLHYVRKGERNMSDLSIHRLEELEKAAGIALVASGPSDALSGADSSSTAYLEDAFLGEVSAELQNLREAVLALERKLGGVRAAREINKMRVHRKFEPTQVASGRQSLDEIKAQMDVATAMPRPSSVSAVARAEDEPLLAALEEAEPASPSRRRKP
jgi:hypothetical protein